MIKKKSSKVIESIESFKKAMDLTVETKGEELKLKDNLQPVVSYNLSRVIDSHVNNAKKVNDAMKPAIKARDEFIETNATEKARTAFKVPSTKDGKAMGLAESVGIKLKESVLDSRDFLGTIKIGDKKFYVTGEKTHTKNYHYEDVAVETHTGKYVGFGRYRWLNRPWQRYDYDSALTNAMIDWKPELKTEITKITSSASSAETALVELAKLLGGELEESLENKQEALKEDKSEDSKVKEYKEEVKHVLDNFKEAYEELKEKLFFGEYDANEFITGKETLELMDMSFAPQSLDELLIGDWVDSVEDSLDKWEPGKVVEGVETRKKIISGKNKEKLTEDLYFGIEDQIFHEVFPTSYNDKFKSIVIDLLERMDLKNIEERVKEEKLDKVALSDEIEEKVRKAMDDGLIYAEDQWVCMDHYQNPEEANFEEMWEALYSDLVRGVEDWVESLELEKEEK